MREKTLLLCCLLFGSALKAQQAGDLDTSFGNNGAVVQSVGYPYPFIARIAEQADQKILVSHQIGTDDFGVWRFNADGSTDNTFGNSGHIQAVLFPSGEENYHYVLVSQPDGKILVAGQVLHTAVNGLRYNRTIVRFNVDGTLDSSFANNGRFIEYETHDTRILNMFLQGDGKIVFSSAGKLMRLNTDGSHDTNFSTDGTADSIAPVDFVWQAANDKIATVDKKSGVVFLQRFNTDGSIDNSFATNGLDTFSMGILHAKQLTNGKFLFCGVESNQTSDSARIVMSQRNANGGLDNTFGSNGYVRSDWYSGYFELFGPLNILSNGKFILSAERIFYNPSADSEIHLFCFNADGSPANNFGNNGMVTQNASNPLMNFGQYAAVQSDNKILLATYTFDPVQTTAVYLNVFRYLSDVNVGISATKEENKDIAIYPNPASDMVTISHANSTQLYALTLYQLNGQIVSHIPNVQNSINIDVSALPAGLYGLQIEDEKGRYHYKLVVR